ncbi:phosphoribosylglycinamide formyltransferase [Cytophagaceae bacterium DM2B3-1]|uniref:Phosphoribosylglycinamide formyltransferase n=1 Tax=Xanthocytophaga flava TaxID=3048013 RepID=A0ABT7CPP2_9BACT|nr:phosphoribosylglycinamide formyltransferase [Xanthocytophaga flavus]MDJ1468811.1 phosphoribosylglycinamide formyltransferase [Xanthocytophaga flavus]MDJ1495671.1 phosphoribosylglycinamide formyltransferase [Xanthocytophaga flavus]
MTSIAIFASGSGSNAQKIMEYFDNHPSIQVKLVLSNKEDAPVLLRAANFMVPTYVFDRKTFYETTKVEEELASYKIDYIVLAGFLWLIPLPLIQNYPDKIINIHPALLPKYGGKGMYGMKVHEAVVQAKDTETGITIHLINEEYDKGEHLFQISCAVEIGDTPERVAEKVHALEHAHFPRIIEDWIQRRGR